MGKPGAAGSEELRCDLKNRNAKGRVAKDRDTSLNNTEALCLMGSKNEDGGNHCPHLFTSGLSVRHKI